MPSNIDFIPDPPDRTALPDRERILKFTTPHGNGYLSFIVLGDGTVNISPFWCDGTVTVNTSTGRVPANVLNARVDCDTDFDEDDSCDAGEDGEDEPCDTHAGGHPVNPELFRRTAPAWNCVDYPGEGMHYTPGTESCQWCGMTRDQINAERNPQ